MLSFNRNTLALGVAFILCASSVRAEELKVLTLNTWFLSVLGVHIGKDQNKRLKILPDKVTSSGADVLVFQEAWSNRVRKTIARELKARGYPYSFYNRRKVTMGDGLEVVSRYPILRAVSSPHFSVATKFEEKFARKRAILVEIALPGGERVEIVTTHLGALNYKNKPGSYHPVHRARQHLQFNELKKWVKSVRRHSKLIIAGDLNSDYRRLSGGAFLPEFDPVYLNFIKGTCGSGEDLLNTFLSYQNFTAADEGDPTFSQDNPYARNGLFSNAPSETEDYILSCGFTRDQVVDSKVVFKENLSMKRLLGSTHPKRLSDHYGVLTNFKF